MNSSTSLNVNHLELEYGSPPKESFRQNMLTAIDHVDADRVLIFEDDDWYHPDYVGLMVGLLDISALVGGRFARYYNVAHRKWSIHPNIHHASLCTTGFRAALLPMVRRILEESNLTRPENPQQLDGTLWKRSGIPDKFKLLLPKSPHVVGMKGMPGKSGLGIDHQLEELRDYEHDPELIKLHAWIGDDADNYARFAINP